MKIERVLIIGSFMYEQFVHGVVSNGWDYMLVNYKMGYKRDLYPIIKGKLFKKFSINQYITNKLEQRIVGSLNEIETFAPTRILLLRGYNFNQSTYRLLADIKVPIYLWAFDSIVRFPEQIRALNIYKKVFAIDGGEIESYNTVRWMPIGYNKEFFYPETEKQYDVIFIGRVDARFYSKRYDYLLAMDKFPFARSFRFAYMGTTGSKFGDYILRRRLKNTLFLGKRKFEDYAAVIRQSKICVNIHQDDGSMPINPMFFSIPAAGVCQVTDDREYFDNWFLPDVEFLPCKLENLEAKLFSLLSNAEYCNNLANNGYKRSIQAYSIGKQVEELFND